jgi:hypothetical protein
MLNSRQDCQNHHPLRCKCWSNSFDVESLFKIFHSWLIAVLVLLAPALRRD